MWLPNKDEVASAVAAMRRAHHTYGYSQAKSDDYLERLFWAGFFAAHLESAPALVAPHNSGERLPSSDAADAGAGTISNGER